MFAKEIRIRSVFFSMNAEKKRRQWRIITPNKSRKRRKIMGEMVYMLKLDSATENIHAHQHTLHILIYIRKVFILCSC